MGVNPQQLGVPMPAMQQQQQQQVREHVTHFCAKLLQLFRIFMYMYMHVAFHENSSTCHVLAHLRSCCHVAFQDPMNALQSMAKVPSSGGAAGGGMMGGPGGMGTPQMMQPGGAAAMGGPQMVQQGGPGAMGGPQMVQQGGAGAMGGPQMIQQGGVPGMMPQRGSFQNYPGAAGPSHRGMAPTGMHVSRDNHVSNYVTQSPRHGAHWHACK